MKNVKIKNKFMKWAYVRFRRLFKSNDKSRFPKNLSAAEKTVSDIFINILHDPESKLYYDNGTSECSMKSESKNMKIFLEERNVKIINSIYGFDRPISADLQYYLEARFKIENSKRRKIMKEEAVAQIENSLSNTLDKIQKSSNKK